MANTGFKGVDCRQTGNQLVLEALLQDSAGALVTTGTTNLRLYEEQSDGTLKSYDFNDSTFKTTALTTATLAMTHRQGNNNTVNTGIWTAVVSTLTGFTVGSIYFAHANNSGAFPADQHRKFQYGSAEGDLVTTANGTGVAELDVDLKMIDGQLTAGNNATLNLKQLNIVNSAGDALVASSTGSNGKGINASGNGSGAGVLATGGATGHGVSAVGGATSGDGISSAAATSGHGITATGVGTTKHGLNATGGSTTSHGINATGGGVGHGILATSGGGATGDGIKAVAASSNGNGLNGVGIGTGAGTLSTGGATGHGISALGGATSGDGISAAAATSGAGITATGVGTTKHGINATGGSTSSDGIRASGGGTGSGLNAIGGATGNGLKAVGGATSGDAILTSATSGHGAVFAGTGTTKHGIHATGGATTSNGINAVGGGVGHGISATSGSGSGGDGIHAGAASTDGQGIAAAGAGTGHGFNPIGGATGHGIYSQGGGTSGDGIRSQAQTSGHGFTSLGTNAGNGIYALGAGAGSGLKANGGSSGIGLEIIGGSSSGDGMSIVTTSGHGFIIAATGTSKHGFFVTGGNGGTSDGFKAVAGTGGVPIRGNITGNITGTLTTVTTLTNLPAITPDWLTATGIATGALNGKGDWLVSSSYPSNFSSLLITPAGKISEVVLVDTLTTYTGDTPQTGDAYARLGAPAGASVSADVAAVKSDTGTLTARLTSARAGYLDNLNVGGAVASHADILALNQSASRRIILTTVAQYERPESGSSTYTVEVRTYDEDGAAVNADSTPTLTATGIVTGDLSANLSAASNPATGVYRWTYTVASGSTIEQVRMDISAAIASSTFTLSGYTQVADFVSATYTTSDRAMLTAAYNKLPSKSYLAGTNNSDGDVQMDEATGNFGGSVASTLALGTQAKLDVNAEADTALADVGLTTTVTGRIDLAISTRMATFTLPTNFSALGINGSGHVSRVTLVDTTTTNTDMRGTNNALLAASYTAPDNANIVVAATQATTAATNSTTLLARIGAFTGTGINTVLGVLRAIMRKDAAITPTDVGGTYDAEFDSLEAQEDQIAGAILTQQQVQDAATAALEALRLDEIFTDPISGAFDPDSFGQAALDAINGSSADPNDIADAVLDRADPVETGWTLRKRLRVIFAAMAGKSSGHTFGASTPKYRDTANTKDRISATTDAYGNRTNVTLDGD